MSSSSTCLADAEFDPAQELATFMQTFGDIGGVVSFVGVARPQTRTGTPVTRLFLDHHPRMTQQSLDEIANSAMEQFEITAVRIVHRVGIIGVKDAIVFVAAGSHHRRAAFEAADYMMDRLKTDAVFWKREDAVDASRWIEPTDADRVQRARWSD
jgi:molybdopterin synthase catalytic subunit